jgi:hypothetical protein
MQLRQFFSMKREELASGVVRLVLHPLVTTRSERMRGLAMPRLTFAAETDGGSV